MFAVNGYGMASAEASLEPISFHRRDPRPHDIVIDILYCGICHADVGLARGEWGFGSYPCVPGHEIIGTVTKIGGDVSKYQVGDRVGVGPLVDSCRICAPCREGFEQMCDTGFTPTYMGPDADFGHTYGGYSGAIVVDENYAVKVPTSLDPARSAPLLCAGITAWAPLKRAGIGAGKTVGVIGIGGVGHLAIKLAKALGATAVALTTSAGKVQDSRRLGADDVLITTDQAAMAASRERFDVILDTVSMPHNLDAYLSLVKRQGELIMVGTPDHIDTKPLSLVFRQKRVSGSFIGGIHETQELFNFCAEHDIGADIEIVAIAELNEAWRRMIAADVHYRFVIDMATLPRPTA